MSYLSQHIELALAMLRSLACGENDLGATVCVTLALCVLSVAYHAEATAAMISHRFKKPLRMHTERSPRLVDIASMDRRWRASALRPRW